MPVQVNQVGEGQPGLATEVENTETGSMSSEPDISEEMAPAIGEWLAAVRDAKGESIVTLEVGKYTPTKGDLAGLAPLLRSIRYCRVFIVADVVPNAKSLSWLDLIVCLNADLAVADDGLMDIPIDNQEPIELQGFVQDTWLRAVGNAIDDNEATAPREAWPEQKQGGRPLPYQPTTLADLYHAHVINSRSASEKVLRHASLLASHYLLALRRAGGIRADATQKGGFNYYMVTKVLVLNALQPTAENLGNLLEGGSKDDQSAIEWELQKSETGGKSILTVTLRAEVVDMTVKDIAAELKPALDERNIGRVNVILPKASEDWLMRTYPREVARKEQSMFKWYRKWELLLGKLQRCAPVHCTLQGPTAPALLELFFACPVRIWACSEGLVGFAGSGFMPGPSVFQALNHLGSAVLKKMLLQGIELEEAVHLGVVITGDGDEMPTPRECAAKMASRVPPVLRLMQSVQGMNYKSQKSSYNELPLLASLIGLSLSLPGTDHELSQAQVCSRLGLDTSPLGNFFKADHIEKRSLADIKDDRYGLVQTTESGIEIPRMNPQQAPGQGALTQKHLRWARALLAEAVSGACRDAGRPISDVGYISVCTSSGYLLPGLTAYVVNDLKLPRNIARCDIVGMGCHAGPNSLQAAVNWAHAHPGKLAIACGVEILSASFIWNQKNKEGSMDSGNINNALCNSLFSDGCFAAAICKSKMNELKPPCYLDFHEFKSQCVTPAMHTMTYQWSDEETQFWFFLSEEAPYAVGAGIHQMILDMQDEGLPLEHIRHFVLHTGGETVIEAASASLGIDLAEVQPTQDALRNYGNNSSGSFMFAFEKMLGTPPCGSIAPGDLGAFMTMGPGAGFEFCLWSAGELSTTDALTRQPSDSVDLQASQLLADRRSSSKESLEAVSTESCKSPEDEKSTDEDEDDKDSTEDTSLDDESASESPDKPPTGLPVFKKKGVSGGSSVSLTTLATERDRCFAEERARTCLVKRVEDPPLSLGVVGSTASAGAHFRQKWKKEERTGPHLLFGQDHQWQTEAGSPAHKYTLQETPKNRIKSRESFFITAESLLSVGKKSPSNKPSLSEEILQAVRQ